MNVWSSRGLEFRRPNDVHLRTWEYKLGASEVVIDVTHSLVSNGTERTAYTGSFAPDSHWASWIKYPFRPGYAAIGRIIDKGLGVNRLEIGQLVAVRGPHASRLVVGDKQCIPLAPDTNPRDAVWFALARIAMLGMMSAGPLEGRQILIVGGGPIAQLCLRWCVHRRGSVALMARSSGSRSAALRGGACSVLDCKTTSPAVREHMSELGSAPDIVIDCTDDASVLSWALESVADYGRIVLVGDPGKPKDRRLTSDLLLRGLSVCGLHDRCTFNKWTNEASASVFFSALSSGTFRTDDLISQTFLSSAACELYETLAGGGDLLGMLIDWQSDDEVA